MEQSDLFEMLRSMRRPGADASAFRNAVWREIRHRQALYGGVTTGKTDDAWTVLWKNVRAPALAASLAAALIAASLVGAMWSHSSGRRSQATARALNLEIFRADAEGLAYVKLASHP